MSAASSSVTCRFGIAVLGLTAFGPRNHSTILSWVLDNFPAISVRLAIPSSGGPTFGNELVTPGIVWQALQAYW